MKAIDSIEQRAIVRKREDVGRIVSVLGSRSLACDFIKGIRQNSRITINFHPDRIASSGSTVAESLSTTGIYRSQYETGISNGRRAAVPGGDRDQWEKTLFAGAYSSSPLRPIYGALDLVWDPLGGAPRFGSSFFVLSHTCYERATLCVGDSADLPSDIGTFFAIYGVAAGILEQSAAHSRLVVPHGVEELVRMVCSGEHSLVSSRALDGYVEAQIHGRLSLEHDVSAILLDPSFVGTDVESDMRSAAERFGIELLWNIGSELHARDVPVGFKGPEIQALGQEIARPDGILDAFSIGKWANNISYTAPSVSGDPSHSPRQLIKRLWHCVVHFGHSALSP